MKKSTKDELTHLLMKTVRLIGNGSSEALSELHQMIEKLEHLKADLPPVFLGCITIFIMDVLEFTKQEETIGRVSWATKCIGEYDMLMILLTHTPEEKETNHD
jgi:hypothetical protein